MHVLVMMISEKRTLCGIVHFPQHTTCATFEHPVPKSSVVRCMHACGFCWCEGSLGVECFGSHAQNAINAMFQQRNAGLQSKRHAFDPVHPSMMKASVIL